MKKTFLTAVFASVMPLLLCAAETIQLPPAALKNDVSLKEALTLRRTDRVFSEKPICDQLLSNILWAANGINRPEKGKRTIPAARGIYAITLYVLKADGIYRHELKNNTLVKISSEDARSYSDGRKMGAKAPVVIVLVADRKAFAGNDDAYIGVEAGAIVQNIHLYCAGAKLNTVVCGSFNRKALPSALKLADDKYVFLTQVIGSRP